jgi:hypothetical protein
VVGGVAKARVPHARGAKQTLRAKVKAKLKAVAKKKPLRRALRAR